MPNWCANEITIQHKDPAMIDRAFAAMNKQEFLNEFVPMPEDFNITADETLSDEGKTAQVEAQENHNLEKHGHKTWYDWCVNNWGTKWDVGDDDCTVKVDANTIEASFDSAWAPPIAAYEKLVAMGFEITAYYDEPGVGFCGKWTGSADGIDDDFRDYEGETSETVRDVIGEELDDHFGISENMAVMEDLDDRDD